MPNGTTICTIENRRVDKFYDLYKSTKTSPPFAKSVHKLIHKHNKQYINKKILRELLLCKSKTKLDIQPLLCGGWPILDRLYDTLDECLHIDRVLHCSPYNMPLKADTYYSNNPQETTFSAELLTHTT